MSHPTPQEFKAQLAALKAAKTVCTVFTQSTDDVSFEGPLAFGELPGQPYGIAIKDGIASAGITIRPEKVISIDEKPHQTVIVIA